MQKMVLVAAPFLPDVANQVATDINPMGARCFLSSESSRGCDAVAALIDLLSNTLIYSESKRGIVINEFIGSTVMLQGVGGTDVEMIQQTDYPWDGRVMIPVNPTVAQGFAVRIRVPNRQPTLLYAVTPEANAFSEIAVNGSQPIFPI